MAWSGMLDRDRFFDAFAELGGHASAGMKRAYVILFRVYGRPVRVGSAEGKRLSAAV